MDRERMGRSHSVGHGRGGMDRFTLRLSEHVRREIVQMGSFRWSVSMAVFRGGRELEEGVQGILDGAIGPMGHGDPGEGVDMAAWGSQGIDEGGGRGIAKRRNYVRLPQHWR